MTESARILQVKAALKQTTSTAGWLCIKQMAENIVKLSIQEALNEEDSIKGESKRLKAKALQAGFTDLFNAIEQTKSIATDEEPDWYTQLSEFENQQSN